MRKTPNWCEAFDDIHAAILAGNSHSASVRMAQFQDEWMVYHIEKQVAAYRFGRLMRGQVVPTAEYDAFHLGYRLAVLDRKKH